VVEIGLKTLSSIICPVEAIIMMEQSRKLSNVVPIIQPKPFAGRSVLADALVTPRNVRAEVEEEFASVSGSSQLGYVSGDSGRIESDLTDSFGVPVRVFVPPKFVYSQSQVDRLNVELKAAEKAKSKAPAKADPPLTMSEQVLEEFAVQALKVQVPLAGSPAAESVMSDIAGTRVSVRPYFKSKKKNLQELDRE
jgi:hypothetical protein